MIKINHHIVPPENAEYTRKLSPETDVRWLKLSTEQNYPEKSVLWPLVHSPGTAEFFYYEDSPEDFQVHFCSDIFINGKKLHWLT